MSNPVADTVIHARWIVDMGERERVLERHAVVIRGERIVGILPQDEARANFTAARHVDRNRHLLMPGLVNAHTHAGMSLLRGIAEDMPLQTWLTHKIWPFEREFADEKFVHDGAALSAAEMLSAGITCFGDMYFFPGETARVAVESGIRACVGLTIAEFGTRWARDADEYLSKALRVRDSLRGEPLVTTAFAPHAPYTVSDATFERIRTLSDELDAGIVIHLHESAAEIEQSTRIHGVRPIDRLARLGILTPALTAVHMTHVSACDIDQAVAAGISVVLCPESNLKLGNGAPPIRKWCAARVPLALGTDGAASNNDQDVWAEGKMAALLGSADAEVGRVGAWEALTMMTRGGAAALGLAESIGTLAAGKLADFICIDFDRPCMQPVHNVCAQLIFAGGRDAVSDVWVGGRQLIEDYEFTHLDWPAIRARAEDWRHQLGGFPIREPRARAAAGAP